MYSCCNRLHFIWAACVLLALPLSASAPGVNPVDVPKDSSRVPRLDRGGTPKYVPGQVLVRFRPGASPGSIKGAHSAVGARVLRRPQLVDRLEQIRLPEGLSVEDAIRSYRRNPDVLYAEPNYIVHPLAEPNDPDFPSLWGLHNTGQEGGTPNADINAVEAWNITTGSSDVVVAVLDSGIDYTHEDLATNLWRNEAECGGQSGVDDDGNGYTDDCYGIDRANLDSDPMDDLGHGTHMAGIIGAVGNNAVGVSGVNWNVKLLPCKFINAYGGGDIAGAIACLDYVRALKDRGVNVVATNNSWGLWYYTQSLVDAIEAHRQRGILFIAAAGNEFSDNDVWPAYPANLYLPNVISVAATTRTDAKATFSNFGRRTVHLGAPGQDILSTTPGNSYQSFSGTSMAAPYVAGVAALLKAQDPTRDWRTIRNLILSGGDPVPALGETVTGRRLNAHGSVACLDRTVYSRLLPVRNVTAGAVGSPLDLAALNIDCGTPNGEIQVTVAPTGETISLRDDGSGGDQGANDGIYSAQWTPASRGSYSLSFPGGEFVDVHVLDNHVFSPAEHSRWVIEGTSLDLDDDSTAVVTSPFPIPFGGGSFSGLFVASNGTISFTGAFIEFSNVSIPVLNRPVVTLVAPFWDDLYPVRGTPQNVFWGVTGTAPNRELVVEWRDVRSFACRNDPSATVTFQVVFSESSSEILFNYTDVTFGGECSWQDLGGAATVGIQVAPSKGAQWAFGENSEVSANLGQSVSDNSAILWQLEEGPGPSSPVPTLTSLSPSSSLPTESNLVLTLQGTNFVPTSQVYWDYSFRRATTFVSSSELRAVITASDLSRPGGYVAMRVVNPTPGGGSSNTLDFAILNPAPTISSLSPSSVVAGSLSFRLTVNGSGFTSSSQVKWNGQDRLTGYYAADRLAAGILYDDLVNAGTAQIEVFNPGSGGGLSNAVTFVIEPPGSTQGSVPPPSLTPRSGASLVPVFIGPEEKRPPGAERPNALVAPPPMRFLGWNYVPRGGTEYLKRFTRPRGKPPLVLQNPERNSRGTQGSIPGARFQSPALAGEAAGFALREALPAGFIPTDIVAGDFNRDGRSDWVVSNGGDSSLWLYLGRGDGTSELPRIIPLQGRSPVAVAAADLQSDSILDLVVAEIDSGTVGILLGNGDGTFASEARYFVPGPPTCLAVEDFTGDGQPDIAVGLLGTVNMGSMGPLAVLPGDGTGRFGIPATIRPQPLDEILGRAVLWLTAADVDRDRDQDLVGVDLEFVGGSAQRAYVYENQGGGSFKRAAAVGGMVWSRTVRAPLGDLNEDGCLDAVLQDPLGFAWVMLGNCDGTFRYTGMFGEGDAGVGIGLADVNADGHLDLVSSGVMLGIHPIWGWEAGNLLCVLLGDGTGSFSIPRVYRGEASAFGLALTDLNQDGHPDVIAANQDSDSASVFLNDGDGGFGSPEGRYVGHLVLGNSEGVINAPISGLIPADMNADGRTDLAFLEWGQLYPEPYQITSVMNDGTGKFGVAVRSPVFEATRQWGDFVLGDFTHQGGHDFLAVPSQYTSNPFLAFAPDMGNGAFGQPKLIAALGAQGVLGIGDFNRDSRLDFVAARQDMTPDPSIGRLSIFLGTGGGAFNLGGSVSYGEEVNPVGGVFPGDFNGDGKIDLLVHHLGNTVPITKSEVYQFLGNGDGTFSPPRLLFPNLMPFALADLDHDGRLDLVESKSSMADYPKECVPEFSIYLGQADGTFHFTQTYAPYAAITWDSLSEPGPILGDFNGDGNTDIAALQLSPAWHSDYRRRAYVQLLLGNGDGTFTPTYNAYEFEKFCTPQSAADLTGDGRADLIELNGWPSSFHVIPATRAPALQLRLVSEPVIGSTGRARVSLNIVRQASTVVTLSASDPAITVPSTLTVPAGGMAQEFEFTIGAGFDPRHVFSLRAELEGDVAVAYGTRADGSMPLGFVLTLNDAFARVQPSEPTRDLIPMITSIGGYSTTVHLECLNLPPETSCQSGSDTLEIPPASYLSTSLVISTGPGTPPGTHLVTVRASDANYSNEATVTLEVYENYPPLAYAGSDRVVEATSASGTAVQLNGSGSSDPDGDPLTYHWTGPFPEGGGTVTGAAPTVTLQAGTNTITLVVNDGKADSAPDSVVITVSDFALEISPASVTVRAGGSAAYTLTLTPTPGPFGREVSFSCSNLPSRASCAFSPTRVTPGGNPATVTLSIATTASGLAPSPMARWPQSTPWQVMWPAILILTALLSRLFVRRGPLPQPVLGGLLILLLVFFAVHAACGGGGTASPPPGRQRTPPGNYSVTVTATSGLLQRSSTATLVVE